MWGWIDVGLVSGRNCGGIGRMSILFIIFTNFITLQSIHSLHFCSLYLNLHSFKLV